MAHITGVKITNFWKIENTVIFKDFEQQNVLAGLDRPVKISVAKAVFFGLGASNEQLLVVDYGDLKKNSALPSDVVLTLKYSGKSNTFQRTILQDFLYNGVSVTEEEYNNWLPSEFLYNDQPVTEGTYNHLLKKLSFDMSKQMLFCDSSNVLCSMLVTRPLDLMSCITGSKKQINAAVKHFRAKNELKKTVGRFRKYRSKMDHGTNKLNAALPEIEASYADEYARYIISNLKREEAERIARKADLETVRAQLDASNGDIQNFKATIERETELRDRKARENVTMLQEIEIPANLHNYDCKLLLDICKMMLEISLKQEQERFKMNQRLLQELERLKSESQWNIDFMRDASGTRRKSRMIPRENLLKLYPIFYGSHELDMDKLELKLIQKKGELTKLTNELEIFHFFEQVFPERKRKEMAESKSIEEILAECNAAVKNVFHPKSFMPNNDELKLKKLRSLIPSDQGFLLNGAFRAIEAQHQCVIENILDDYSSVIVLFKDTAKSMHEKLKREYAQWYLNVTFLVLSELPNPRKKEGYVAPTGHWLNYCTFTLTHIDDRNRRKLMLYLGTQLEIYFVETGDEVKDAYVAPTKKYAASTDGQYMYARDSFGIDFIRYIIPGKAPIGMEFGAACHRLEEALQKLNEFTVTLMETENVPRQPPVSNTAALQAEVDKLEQQFDEKLQIKNDNMMVLHRRINEPYEVSDIQNYDDAMQKERLILADINKRITEAQSNETVFKCAVSSLSDKINKLGKYIEVKGKMAVNKQDIGKHNKVIKESERQITKLNMTIGRLQFQYETLLQTIKSLKYRTIKTVLQAHQEGIDLTTVDCNPEPPTLWQHIRDGIYIDPQVMQINFNDMTDTFDPDVFYASRRWYAVRDQYRLKLTELRDNESRTNVEKKNADRRFNNLRDRIVEGFLDAELRINALLNDIGKEIHPNEGIVYELTFNFDELVQRKAAIFKITIDGDAIGFNSLSKLNRLRTSWLLFAALNELSQAPFAFIELEQMDDEAATMIYPIILRMSQKIQLFVDASSTRYSHLANVHYGLNSNDSDDQPLTKVLRYDGTQFVSDDGQVPGTSTQRDGAVAQETDAQETDAQETDAQETDAQETDAQETDAQETVAQETDAQEADAQEADAQEADAQEADAQEADAQ